MNDSQDWWNKLELNEISQELPTNILQMANSEGIDVAGSLLDQYASKVSVGILPKYYWKNFKKEFFLLVCTDHRRYAETREQLSNESNQTSTVIISIISAAIAETIGLAAGTITPFCLLCLLVFLKLGKEAFCESITSNLEDR